MTARKAAEEMLNFIQKSPTCFHAVENLKGMLETEGYKEWKETEEWNVVKGGKYYVVRNDSSLIALQFPAAKDIKGFHMVASHSDSPSFKVKEGPEILVEKQYVKLNTEKYDSVYLAG